MRFTLECDLDKDAFSENAGEELASVLRSAADMFEGRDRLGETVGKLTDGNGNYVASFQILKGSPRQLLREIVEAVRILPGNPHYHLWAKAKIISNLEI